MAKVLTAPQLPAGRRITVDDQGSNGEIDAIVVDLSSGGVPAPSTSFIVYVSSVFGSDTIGDGTVSAPYATINHAYSTITTASAAQVWTIVVFPGTYAENIAIRPFIRIDGWDPSRDAGGFYPVRITGTFSLDAAFATAGSRAWVNWCDLDGSVSLDFVTATSTDGAVSFTGCQFEADLAANGVLANVYELHDCTLFNTVTQTGCTAGWYGTAGTSFSLLHVLAGAASGARLDLFDSVWEGSVTADQNGNVTSAQTVIINLNNSQARNGTCTVIAAGSNNPTINGAYGATAENPVLSGSSAVALSRNMRVSLTLTVPSGTAMLPGETADVTIPLTSGILGATSVEELSCDFTPHGTLWTSELAAQNCVWSFYVRKQLGTNEVHVVIGNINTAGTVTTANPLEFTFAGFASTIAP